MLLQVMIKSPTKMSLTITSSAHGLPICLISEQTSTPFWMSSWKRGWIIFPKITFSSHSLLPIASSSIRSGLTLEQNQKFISKDVRRSKEFQHVRDNFSVVVRRVAQLLGEHSVPFWSPRYEAHMCTDLTMPSLLGYFMTMLYNPNNVALEASPLTTVAELKVGEQLCELFGYKTDNTPDPTGARKSEPKSWGHVTCDGTVANLESIWVGMYFAGTLGEANAKTATSAKFEVLSLGSPASHRQRRSWFHQG